MARCATVGYHPSMTRDPTTSPGPAPELSLATLATVHRRLLPWLLVTWAVAAVLPGPGAQQVFLLLGASPFYGAATARALGLHPGWSTPALAVDRAFTHLTALLVLFALAGLAAAVGATLGGMAASATRLPDERILSLPFAAAATLPILWWHWPATLLAYLVPEQAGYRVRAGRAWRGPRYGDARRLARFAGQPRRLALLLTFLYLWVAVLLIAGGGARGPALAFGIEAASYLLVLPMLLTWAAIEIMGMIRRAGPEAPEAESGVPRGDGRRGR
jgi:hypothetical protein